MPTGYEREYTASVGWRIRRRVGFSTDRGDVTRFVVQLEYRVEDEWLPVVRFDHDPESERGHDVTEEGLHPDVYRDGEKYVVDEDFPRMDLKSALAYCETHVEAHALRYVRRSERWHDLHPRTNR